jgi:hypothetical protein
LIEADVTILNPPSRSIDPEECVLLFFVNGVWELADPTDA